MIVELEDLATVVDMRLDIQAVNILVEESYSDAVCPRCERTGAVADSTNERQWMCGTAALALLALLALLAGR